MLVINWRKLFLLFSIIFVILPFQNCSKVQLSATDNGDNASLGQNGDGEDGGEHSDANDNLGLKGGHFDFDTASSVYDANEGKTDRHTHEYDNQFDIRYIDLFNILNSNMSTSSFVSLNDRHTKIVDRISPTQEFVITVANAENSKGVILNINGTRISSVDYQNKVDQFLSGDVNALETFTLATLNQFQIEFNSDTISENVLVPIHYACPVQNKLSSSGQYRNGAFIIQIHDKSKVKLDAKMRVATKDGGLRWEAFMFWHRDKNCR